MKYALLVDASPPFRDWTEEGVYVIKCIADDPKYINELDGNIVEFEDNYEIYIGQGHKEGWINKQLKRR